MSRNLFATVVSLPLLLPLVLWLWLDHRVWDWDPAEYAYFAIDLWRCFWEQRELWPWMFIHGVGPKAPTIIWIGHFMMPLRHLLGSTEVIFHIITLLFQAGSLFLVCRTVLEITARRPIAVLTTMLVAGMPLFAGMTFYYLTEPLQLFAIALMWYVAICSRFWSPWAVLAGLLWASAFALGSKASTPIYCVIPGLYAVFYLVEGLFRRRSWPALVHWIGMVTGAIHLFVISAWYVLTFDRAMEKVVDATFGEKAHGFGYAASFGPKLIYWLRTTGRAITLPEVSLFFLLLVLSAIFAVLWFRLEKQSQRISKEVHRSNRVIVWLAILQVVVVYIVLSVNISTPIRYVYGLIPSLMIPAAILLVEVRSGLYLRVLMMGAFLWYLLSHAVYLGYLWPEGAADREHWHPPEREGVRLAEVRRVIDLLQKPERHERYNLVGANFNWLSASTLNYYASLDSLESGIRPRFSTLGNVGITPESALKRVHLELTTYITAADNLMITAGNNPYDVAARHVTIEISRMPEFDSWLDPQLSLIQLFRNVTLSQDGGRPND